MRSYFYDLITAVLIAFLYTMNFVTKNSEIKFKTIAKNNTRYAFHPISSNA